MWTPTPGSPQQPYEDVIDCHFVICHNTRDFPGKYTVRRHLIMIGKTRPAELMGPPTMTLNEARRQVPAGKIPLKPAKQDDSVIVETWI